MILSALKYDLDRFLKLGIFLYAVSGMFVAVWLCLLSFWNPSTSIEKFSHFNANKNSHTTYLFPLDAIGSGPLALRPKIACGWMSRIAEEISVVSFNSRPDVLQKDAKILIVIRESKEQSILNNGKIMFLKERSEGKGLAISDTPTALWIKPILLDNGNVLIEAGRKLISKQGQLINEEKGEFISSLQRTSAFRHHESHLTYFSDLKTAQHLGQDPLIAQYGGKEYANWKEKIKCQFTSDGKSYAVFVSSGDFLQFKDGEWRCIRDGVIDPHLPLAHVISTTSKEVQVHAWDDSGFFSVDVAVLSGKLNSTNVTHDLLPTSLRLRSNTQVSCIFGKRRLIIKKGDWLLRTAAGWRNLRKAQDIEDCLFHRIKGELFIFDQIEKQGGKHVLQGHLFDAQRTLSTLVVLPIDTEKKGSHSKSKKDKQI